MRLPILLILLSSFFFCPYGNGEDGTGSDTVQDLAIYLVDPGGRQIQVYPLPSGNIPKDVLLKSNVPSRYAGFRHAAVEFNDPSQSLRQRLELGATIPPVIHWDGLLGENASIQHDRRYFMRLILEYEDGRVLSSPWAFFKTRLKSSYDDARRIRSQFINLYILPSGGMQFIGLKTKQITSFMFPNVYGDLRLVWRNLHSIIIRLEATSNLLFDYTITRNGFAYSDFSLSYRYRLAGAPMRAPILPVEPPAGNFKYRLPPGRADAYGKPFNAEVGTRVFYTTIRGNGTLAIDPQLARRFQGLALTLDADRSWGALRFHFGGEAGYSLFKGKLITGSAHFAISYDRFETVAPGVEGRYMLFMGTPENDPFDGTGNTPTKVVNHLGFGGVFLRFKL